MSSITSKTGITYKLATPQTSDLNAIFTYAKALETEDTFVTLHPSDPISLEEEEKWLESVIQKCNQHKAIYQLLFDKDQVIGICSIEVMGRKKKHVGKFAISLHQTYRDQGLGYQLAQATIHLANQNLHLSLLLLEVFAINTSAKHLYAKLGFQYIGTVPKAILHRGRLIDEIIMALSLKHES